MRCPKAPSGRLRWSLVAASTLLVIGVVAGPVAAAGPVVTVDPTGSAAGGSPDPDRHGHRLRCRRQRRQRCVRGLWTHHGGTRLLHGPERVRRRSSGSTLRAQDSPATAADGRGRLLHDDPRHPVELHDTGGPRRLRGRSPVRSSPSGRTVPRTEARTPARWWRSWPATRARPRVPARVPRRSPSVPAASTGTPAGSAGPAASAVRRIHARRSRPPRHRDATTPGCAQTPDEAPGRRK